MCICMHVYCAKCFVSFIIFQVIGTYNWYKLNISFACYSPYFHRVSCNLCCVMQNDRTPLYLASLRGHTEIVAMLLKFGADFSSCDTVSTSYFITPISAVSE